MRPREILALAFLVSAITGLMVFTFYLSSLTAEQRDHIVCSLDKSGCE